MCNDIWPSRSITELDPHHLYDIGLCISRTLTGKGLSALTDPVLLNETPEERLLALVVIANNGIIPGNVLMLRVASMLDVQRARLSLRLSILSEAGDVSWYFRGTGEIPSFRPEMAGSWLIALQDELRGALLQYSVR